MDTYHDGPEVAFEYARNRDVDSKRVEAFGVSCSIVAARISVLENI